MVLVVEMSEDERLEQQSEGERGGQGEQQAEPEIPGPGGEREGEIGADHVLHAVRQVDEVHHPEHEREPRRDQEQDDPELQAVERLDQDERGVHRSPFMLPASARRRRLDVVTGRFWRAGPR